MTSTSNHVAATPAVGERAKRSRWEAPTELVVFGYASRDHAMAVGEFLGAGGTTLVRERLSSPWPASGGIAHVVRAAAAAGLTTSAVSWVGRDAEGRAWRQAVESCGTDVSGVAARGTRTPAAYLFYPDDGATICVYDKGDCHEGELTDEQRAVLAAASWCVFTVSPSHAAAAALQALPAQARLAWVVKNDPDAFPVELARQLAERASLVTYSRSERAFLTERLEAEPTALASGGRLVVETCGADGATWWAGDEGGSVEPRNQVRDTRAGDTTGAGDTLVAATVAALHAGASPGVAVEHGVEAASRLMHDRREATT